MSSDSDKNKFSPEAITGFFSNASDNLLNWVKSVSETLECGEPDLNIPDNTGTQNEPDTSTSSECLDISDGNTEETTIQDICNTYTWIDEDRLTESGRELSAVVIDGSINTLFTVKEEAARNPVLFREIIPVTEFAGELIKVRDRIAKILVSQEYEPQEKTNRIGSHLSGIFAKLLAKIGPVKVDNAVDDLPLNIEITIVESGGADARYYEIEMNTAGILKAFFGK